MTKREFYDYQEKPFRQRHIVKQNRSIHETDPSFAQSGLQIFMAGVQGTPIYGNNVEYYYNGIDSSNLMEVDKMYPDKFTVANELKATNLEIRNNKNNNKQKNE